MDEEWNVNDLTARSRESRARSRVLVRWHISERRGRSVAINIYGEQDMKVFESGVVF